MTELPQILDEHQLALDETLSAPARSVIEAILPAVDQRYDQDASLHRSYAPLADITSEFDVEALNDADAELARLLSTVGVRDSTARFLLAVASGAVVQALLERGETYGQLVESRGPDGPSGDGHDLVANVTWHGGLLVPADESGDPLPLDGHECVYRVEARRAHWIENRLGAVQPDLLALLTAPEPPIGFHAGRGWVWWRTAEDDMATCYVTSPHPALLLLDESPGAHLAEPTEPQIEDITLFLDVERWLHASDGHSLLTVFIDRDLDRLDTELAASLNEMVTLETEIFTRVDSPLPLRASEFVSRIARASVLTSEADSFAAALRGIDQPSAAAASLGNRADDISRAARRLRDDVRSVHDTLSQAIAAEQLETAQTEAAKSARFQSTVTFLTATLLTPTLVGTIYGANVVELDAGKPSIAEMLVVMIATALVTYTGLRALELKPFAGTARYPWHVGASIALWLICIAQAALLIFSVVGGWSYIVLVAALALSAIYATASALLLSRGRGPVSKRPDLRARVEHAAAEYHAAQRLSS